MGSITETLTSAIADHGILAVFGLMGIDALLPVGGELIMLYAGVIASGAPHFVALAAAGSVGYLLGALIGWAIGRRGGRQLVDRHGRWLHLSPERLDRAERWFARWGRAAVLLGRLTPIVRSFISVPAGVLGSPLAPYTALTLVGSAIWCFAFAGVGWAIGDSWTGVHDGFRYADYVVLGLIVLAAVSVIARRRSARSPR